MIIIKCENAKMLERFVNYKDIKRSEAYFYIEIPLFNDLYLLEDNNYNNNIYNKEVTVYHAYGKEITNLIKEVNNMLFNFLKIKIYKQSELFKSFLRVLVQSSTLLEMSGAYSIKEKQSVYYRAIALHIMNCISTSNSFDHYKDDRIDDLIIKVHRYNKEQMYLNTQAGVKMVSNNKINRKEGFIKIESNDYELLKKIVVDEKLINKNDLTGKHYIYIDMNNYRITNIGINESHKIELSATTYYQYENAIKRFIIPLNGIYISENSNLYKSLLMISIVDNQDFQRACQVINHYILNDKIHLYYDCDTSMLLEIYSKINYSKVYGY